MKRLFNLSALIVLASILGMSSSYGQSCDTLRNYAPTDPLYQLEITTESLVLGHMTGADGTDTYNLEEWAEKYTVPAPTQVKAVRLAPWKIQNTSSTASLTIQIYDDAGTQPGTVIGSQVVNFADLD